MAGVGSPPALMGPMPQTQTTAAVDSEVAALREAVTALGASSAVALSKGCPTPYAVVQHITVLHQQVLTERRPLVTDYYRVMLGKASAHVDESTS